MATAAPVQTKIDDFLARKIAQYPDVPVYMYSVSRLRKIYR